MQANVSNQPVVVELERMDCFWVRGHVGVRALALDSAGSAGGRLVPPRFRWRAASRRTARRSARRYGGVSPSCSRARARFSRASW